MLKTWQMGYMAGWGLACVIAAVLFATRWRSFAITQRAYWRLLLQPWKIVIFICSAGAITVMAPYTGDPTWDYVDAFFMAFFAFTTAPWTTAVLYRAVRRREGAVAVYVAACVWMFSASWSYDGYLVLRDGVYPATWAANIFASGFLYLMNGLLYSLERGAKRPATFSFLHPDWPNIEPTGLSREVALLIAVIAIPVGLSLLAFVGMEYGLI